MITVSPEYRLTVTCYFKPVMDVGFCITPSLLMKAKARIGLNPVQFDIVMHPFDQW